MQANVRKNKSAIWGLSYVLTEIAVLNSYKIAVLWARQY